MYASADFTENTVDGMYQVFVSLQNFHTFVAQYLENLDDMCGGVMRKLPAIVDQFGRGEPKEKINAMSILAGALGVGAAASGGNPALAGTLGALGGIVGIVDAASKEEDNIPDITMTENSLIKMVDQTCSTAKGKITKALEAVMGNAPLAS